ncbi:MAG: diguanylate cyclase [Anaerosomatales bacterium]|nr:diguanylate cyclase [Anaerosomatales bacterium]MDI6843661.1 diguanylate cyclase [Anaerosomatales bacterium]
MLGSDEGEQARSRRWRLGPVISVAATWVFVAVLLSFAGSSANSLWPLFVIPTALAGAFFGLPGGVVCGAVSALAVFLLMPEPSTAAWVGVGAFTVAAVLVGVKSTRDEQRVSGLRKFSAFDPDVPVFAQDHFRLRLHEEARRSARYRQPFGVLSVSIAGYGEFVRKFGTHKGKAMMARLAEAVRVAVRDSDLIGRLGDGELGVLLPQAAPSECVAVASRLADVVARTRFEGDAVEPYVSAEALIAWAVFPEDADGVEGLLRVLRERSAMSASGSREAGATR